MLNPVIANMLIENRHHFMISADMVATVSENNPLSHAFLVLTKVRYAKIPVLDHDSKFKGLISLPMITETMLGLDHMSFNSLDTMTVKDVMQTEVATIDDPYDLENVLHLLVDNPFIPVVQDGYFTGIITRREVMKGINNIGHNIDKNFQLEPLTVTVPKES
ncbi:cyclic-di-AMP-binding protein CbpB [Lacticaseibacillus paracasei]|uniref:CBS domain-containing protein n=1 Tax=Lacticaseibacillus paracasei subsp. paracasei Lpp14 TaxID=1256204 RepID=A0A829GPB1_LACPA|nr:cyclic-di-AMP-binding protein CbpB [Lacticaseibacillus paracasei]EPC61050.1 CBS domain-containing protein [Lacticaseibacillus paracasei subsp. paracasei Lpp14]MDM7526375.1 cyclic-di-AMP-binding protein CbpB [Lacticaseibacillus paracasei]MDM7529191.1 cyclic-di-AMP-binding protein CbpB [Lacticaseibacillus paracasei]MDM7541319.1 cyclic-di-AMP-binding protein CbpB [Lacticaseibacillus paracasei]RND61871.1 CBS domain-containing protein YkuL [Lacticaseibacillus paracasei]